MAITAAVVLGAVSVGYQIHSGNKQQEAKKKQLALQQQANQDAKQRAKEAADRNEVEMNKANQKKVNVGALQSKEEQAAMAGPAGTMLTGNQGVTNDQYNLGGNTLLGG